MAKISEHLQLGLIESFAVISQLKAMEHYTSWGVYEEELKLSFPCDGFIEQQDAVYYRGITINAAPEVIFRWLCQLRIAPYSYDWVDNFGIKSPDTLTQQGMDELVLGQQFMKSFKLVDFEQGRHLTILMKRDTPKSESHIEYILSRLFGDIAISYLIVPKGPDRCRLLVKVIVRYPRGIIGGFMRIFLPWGDKIMMSKQLLNFKKLSERGRT